MLMIVQCANRRLDFVGLFHLFKLFLKYCYEPDDPDPNLFAHKYVPRPNDFSDYADYFVRKVRCLSTVHWSPRSKKPCRIESCQRNLSGTFRKWEDPTSRSAVLH